MGELGPQIITAETSCKRVLVAIAKCRRSIDRSKTSGRVDAMAITRHETLPRPEVILFQALPVKAM